MPGRDAILRLGMDSGKLDGTMTTARRKLKAFGSQVKSDLRTAVKGAFDGLGTISGFAGVAGLAVAGRDVWNFEKSLTRLQIQARKSAGDMALLRKQIYDIGGVTGVDPDQLLAGISQFVSVTGDINTATASMKTWATVSAATGSSMTDIANAAAGLSINLGISGDEMERAFSIMLTQGKDGAIELKDMASITQSLSAQFKTFGKTGVDGLAEMGAMLQIVRGGFGTTEEAATGFSALLTAITKEAAAGKIKHAFVIGPDGKRHLKDAKDLVFQIIEQTKGDPARLEKLLGRAEAYKAILPLMDAGKEKLDEWIKSGLQSNELMKDFETYSKSAAGQVDRANAAIKKTFSDLLVKNLDSIATALTAVASAITFIAQHPMESLAIFASLKGGGYLASVGEALAKGGGGAAAGGASRQLSLPGLGGSGGGMFSKPGSITSTIGTALQRAAIGVAVAETLGKDLPRVSQGALVLGHALTALPGPLGGVATGAALAADALLAYAAYLDHKIDKRNEQILKSPVGGYELTVGTQFGRAQNRIGDLEYKERKGTISDAERSELAAQRASRAPAAEHLLKKAMEVGALKQNAAGGLSLDTSVTKGVLASSGMSKGDQDVMEALFEKSFDAALSDPSIRADVAEMFARGARTGFMNALADVGAGVLAGGGPAPTAAAPRYAPGGATVPKETVRVTVGVKDGDVVAAVNNSRKQRTKEAP